VALLSVHFVVFIVVFFKINIVNFDLAFGFLVMRTVGLGERNYQLVSSILCELTFLRKALVLYIIISEFRSL
jgi:hypothetical protein